MTTEEREWPLGVVLTLTTGMMLCDSFGQMHELAEWLVQHPIWTHEFADRELSAQLREAVLQQCPPLREVKDYTLRSALETCPDATRESREQLCRDWLAEWERRLECTTVRLHPVPRERTEGPIESLQRLAPGKPVLLMGGPAEEGR